MTGKKKFRAVRGVRDILPPDSSLWNWFENTAREVLESYNFREIRLPIFEETELFARSIGAETDVVNKEMYSFAVGGIQERQNSLEELVDAVERAWQDGAIERTEDNSRRVDRIHQLHREAMSGAGGAAAITHQFGPANTWERIHAIYDEVNSLSLKITLRPEATASVVRAYIEHGMQTQPGLVKLFYLGPMFRRERPQKGRYRQFYQIGAEVLGASDHPAIDAELIEMLTVMLDRAKIKDWKLLINSIGDANCRPAYVEMLREELRKVKDQLGPDSQRRTETNPLRVFDSKLPEEQAIIEKLPRITDYLCDACKQHFLALLEQLDLRQIRYTIEPRLVRGLDYYTRTAFEIAGPHQGAQNALGGGGRYDGLTEMLGGPPAKGIGFALGEDRIIEMIEDAHSIDAKRPLDVFIAWMGSEAYPAAVRLARRLRGEGLCVELPAEERKLGKALNLADRLGARHAVIVGEEELLTGQLTVKRLFGRREPDTPPDRPDKLSEDKLLEYLSSSERHR